MTTLPLLTPAARGENCLVKLPHSLEFECLLLSNRFTTSPSLFFWIYFVVFSLVDLLFYNEETL